MSQLPDNEHPDFGVVVGGFYLIVAMAGTLLLGVLLGAILFR